jgi:thiol-disulfide isomerase/thioredoxin
VSPGSRVTLAIAVVCLGGASGFLAARLARAPSTQGLVDTNPTQLAGEGAATPPGDEKSSGATPAGPGSSPGPSPSASASSPRTIPVKLPNISLADTDGVKHALSEWKGRPLLINFWATWCEPCRREIPLLKTLRHERAADGVEVIGIAVDFRDAVRRYAREMGIDYPVLVGEQDGLDAIAAFGMDTVFPFTVFADAQGRIVTLKIGELHADEGRFILDEVKAIDQGRIDLRGARKSIADGIAALAAGRAQADETNGSPGEEPADPRK